MTLMNEIESILNSNGKKTKKRKLKVKEKWYLDEVYPLFKNKFPVLTTEDDVERFLSWAKQKKFSKKELAVIKMSRETVLPKHYKTVWTEQDLDELVIWLSNLDIVAIDTETTGTDKYRDEIVGISFYAPHQGYYIPLKHNEDIKFNKDAYEEFKFGSGESKLILGADYVKCLPIELVAEKLKPQLERKNLKQIYHNYGFDYHIIRRCLNAKTVCYFDTMIAQAVLDENQSKALKNMATYYLKISSDTFSTLFGNVIFDKVPILINPKNRTGNMATFYAAKDTELTYKMYEFQIKHLESPNLKKIYNLYFNIEIPFINIVVKTEERGVRADKDYLVTKVAPQLHRELDELKESIYRYTGRINLNSPLQLSKVLYEDLKLPHVNTESPNSTDAKTLTKLKKEHEVIPMIMEYRKKEKLVDAFADKLPNQIIDDRIHTSFSTIMKTGRMSSSNPNLQQMPSYTNLIRNAFIADEGRLLASIDFSSQELRVLTEVSGDKVMFDIFTTGGDAHATTAISIWNKKYPDKQVSLETFQRLRKVSDAFRDKDGELIEDKFNDDGYLNKLLNDGIILTKDTAVLIKEAELGLEFEKVRKKSKTVNFGIVYGISEIGLADKLEISKEEARMYIHSYMQTYPGVAKWIENTKKIINKKMYVETLLGRKRRLYPEVTSGKQWLLESAYRMGCNSQVQGSAADMIKKAAIDLQPVLKKYDSHIVLFVHDEIIFDVPENIGMGPLQEFADIMCNAIPLKCGMKADIELGKRWGQKLNEDEIKELFDEGEE